MKTIFLVIFFGFSLSSCTLYNLVAPPRIYVRPEITAAMRESETFIGKTKQDVLNHYGKPRFVDHNVLKNAPGRANNSYDEWWSYRFDAGIPIIAPDQYGIHFYFIGDVVSLVSG